MQGSTGVPLKAYVGSSSGVLSSEGGDIWAFVVLTAVWFCR